MVLRLCQHCEITATLKQLAIILSSFVVITSTICFNNQFCLPIDCTYPFHTILRVNGDCFLNQLIFALVMDCVFFEVRILGLASASIFNF